MTFTEAWNQSLLFIHSSYVDAPVVDTSTPISPETTTKTNALKKFLPNVLIPPNSTDIKNSLFHLNLIAEAKKSFPFTLEMQYLSSYLLLYTKKGKFKLTYHNKQFYLNDNSIMFINCNNYHKIDLLEQSWDFELLYLDGPQIDYYYSLFCQNGLPYCSCVPNSESINSLHKLYYYQEESTTTIQLKRNELITTLLTNLILTKDNDCNQVTFVPNHVKLMMNILHNRYSERHSLDSLAKELNYNKYKLAKDFKKYVHTSPIDYLIQRRIEVAKQLLLNTDHTINDISELVGISNIPHFIHLFKSQTLLTPNQYRITQKETRKYL